MRNLDFSFLIPYIPQLVEAAKITVELGVLSFWVALCIAVTVGTLRSTKIPMVCSFILTLYVEIFRGTPLLIQLFFIYYGLPTFGIMLQPVTAAVCGLSLNCGAYMSEIVRAAILSIDKGQYEAAYSLGYTKFQTYKHIVLPQAFRISVPPFMNYFSTMLKETSLVSVLSIPEITRIANQIYARTLSPFEIYLTIGAIYFALTYSVALIARVVERKSAIWAR